MKNISKLVTRSLCTVLTCMLISSGSTFASAAATTDSVPTNSDTATIKSGESFVYYVSNSVLYRTMSDGSKNQKLLKNFQGVKLTPAGNYLYYMYDEKSTTLLRIPMDGSANIASRFQSDVLYFVAEGEFIYYMNDKGAIYRAPANSKNASEAKLITDMADVKQSRFSIIDGKVYYNALKSGRTTWVASKAIDGSGQVQWIAEGAISDPWFIHAENDSINMVVDTKPQETRYSLDCMVIYSVSKKDGTVKAINAATPLDTNATYSGLWTKDYFMYNKDIKLDSENEYDYAKSKGSIIDMKGTSIDLHDTGIQEIANLTPEKLAFVDAYGKAFVGTIKDNKVIDKKTLSIENAGYVRNLITDGKIRATMLFAESGAYMLQSDLSLKKMVGVEWDLCVYKDNVNGFFYVNAGDNGRLYRMNDDGKTNTKLSNEKVDRIVLISKN